MAFNANVSRAIQPKAIGYQRIDPNIQRGLIQAALYNRKAMDDYNSKIIDDRLKINAMPGDVNRANAKKNAFFDELKGLVINDPSQINQGVQKYLDLVQRNETDAERQAINSRGQFYTGRLAEFEQIKNTDWRSA